MSDNDPHENDITDHDGQPETYQDSHAVDGELNDDIDADSDGGVETGEWKAGSQFQETNEDEDEEEEDEFVPTTSDMTDLKLQITRFFEFMEAAEVNDKVGPTVPEESKDTDFNSEKDLENRYRDLAVVLQLLDDYDLLPENGRAAIEHLEDNTTEALLMAGTETLVKYEEILADLKGEMLHADITARSTKTSFWGSDLFGGGFGRGSGGLSTPYEPSRTSRNNASPNDTSDDNYDSAPEEEPEGKELGAVIDP